MAARVATQTLVAIGNMPRYLWSVRIAIVALALLFGLGSTDAFAKDAVLVKLRDGSSQKAAPKAKSATKSSSVGAKRKPVRRAKAVAKAKPKAKPKAKQQTPKATESEIRPMP